MRKGERSKAKAGQEAKENQKKKKAKGERRPPPEEEAKHKRAGRGV